MGSNPIRGFFVFSGDWVRTMAKDDRFIIGRACSDCKERNYHTSKNTRNDPERLELKKFCPRCGKHTSHRETK